MRGYQNHGYSFWKSWVLAHEIMGFCAHAGPETFSKPQVGLPATLYFPIFPVVRRREHFLGSSLTGAPPAPKASSGAKRGLRRGDKS